MDIQVLPGQVLHNGPEVGGHLINGGLKFFYPVPEFNLFRWPSPGPAAEFKKPPYKPEHGEITLSLFLESS
ncbi:hypothetical protein hamaS1_03530 [Moorella sp. Hama-1]|nr:hypothetical protein hamaS1_03530 [Moorella sp. Hama-1]